MQYLFLKKLTAEKTAMKVGITRSGKYDAPLSDANIPCFSFWWLNFQLRT